MLNQNNNLHIIVNVAKNMEQVNFYFNQKLKSLDKLGFIDVKSITGSQYCIEYPRLYSKIREIFVTPERFDRLLGMRVNEYVVVGTAYKHKNYGPFINFLERIIYETRLGIRSSKSEQKSSTKVS